MSSDTPSTALTICLTGEPPVSRSHSVPPPRSKWTFRSSDRDERRGSSRTPPVDRMPGGRRRRPRRRSGRARGVRARPRPIGGDCLAADRSSARSQRGANGQPGGRCATSGGSPGIWYSVAALDGGHVRHRQQQPAGVRIRRPREELRGRSRSRRSCRRTSRSTRSVIPATTPRSCVIRITLVPVSALAAGG